MIEGIWDEFFIFSDSRENLGPIRITLINYMNNNMFYITGGKLPNIYYRYLSIDPVNMIAYFENYNTIRMNITDIIDKKSYKIFSPNIALIERATPFVSLPPITTPPITTPPTPGPTIESSLVEKLEGIWDLFFQNNVERGPLKFYYVGNNMFYIDGVREYGDQFIYEDRRYIKVNPNTLMVTQPYYGNNELGKVIFRSDNIVIGEPTYYDDNRLVNGFMRYKRPYNL
jgi:hypothetical protein